MSIRLPSLSEHGPAQARHDDFVKRSVDALRSVGLNNIDLSEASVAVPIDRPTRANDKIHDGAILGALGVFSALTGAHDVAPVLPDNGAVVRENVILVNGIMTDIHLQLHDMQGLANTGCAVVGVHNATEGLLPDLLECVLNKLKRGDTPAIDTLSRLIARGLEDDRPLHLIGHSQGALIIARALQIVSASLADAGLPATEIKGLLGRITIETHGGASANYVDGPHYCHHVNLVDIVPMISGVGMDAYNPFGSVGENASVKTFVAAHMPKNLGAGDVAWRFARATDQAVHGPCAVYWAQRGKI